MLSLSEATRLIKEHRGNPQVLAENKDMMEYVTEVMNVGKSVLEKVSDDEKISAISMIQSIVMMDLLEDGDIGMLLVAMQNVQSVGHMMAIAMRCAVGIAALEEWR